MLRDRSESTSADYWRGEVVEIIVVLGFGASWCAGTSSTATRSSGYKLNYTILRAVLQSHLKPVQTFAGTQRGIALTTEKSYALRSAVVSWF
jgi:hypothetical protein